MPSIDAMQVRRRCARAGARSLLRVAAIGLMVGFISSGFGIGGTLVAVLVLVPAVLLPFSARLMRMVAVSMLTILCGSLAGAVVASILGGPTVR